MAKWIYKTKHRYYIIRLERNLFNEWCIFKSWGEIYNKLGGSKLDTFNTKEAALKELNSIASRRTGRGYIGV
ncbi:MAG: hypothetical protein K0R73_678 [Candidatus Midichloriaceae bacterium]|jgi:predicted DNA-binding WGR domain protein|nr:hypothetical protein [Candidatus Midichloriaceae bacterium]